MPGNFGIVLLAAGSSSRMGQSRQLLEINGEPLLRNEDIARMDFTEGETDLDTPDDYQTFKQRKTTS